MEWARHDCKATKRRERFGEGYRFCPYCGVKLEKPIAEEPELVRLRRIEKAVKAIQDDTGLSLHDFAEELRANEWRLGYPELIDALADAYGEKPKPPQDSGFTALADGSYAKKGDCYTHDYSKTECGDAPFGQRCGTCADAVAYPNGCCGTSYVCRSNDPRRDGLPGAREGRQATDWCYCWRAASESAEAKPDDEIAVTRNCLETWAYLAENMPGYGDFRAILAQSIRAVIPADRPKPSGKIELSRVLLEDWDERLRETAAPLCPSRTTRTILTIASHMRAILDSYAKDPPELPPVKIEVSRKKLEDWLAKANEIYHVFDAKCPMGREFCELAGKAAFIADCLSPRIQEVLDNDE